MRCLVAVSLLLTACMTHSNDHRGKSASPVERGELFLPSQDAMQDVKGAIEKAAANDSLALVVLGANWCHDSRALAARMQLPPLAPIISEHYEPVFVDVGYLDQARDIGPALGTPIYYATPTVLIVDPDTGQLVNDGDRHQWGEADSISMEESVAYFERMAAEAKKSPESATAISRWSDTIDEFERQLAAKVARGYQRVGPMLKAYKEGGDVPASFEDDWTEVAKFRNSVPEIVDSLRQQALEEGERSDESAELVFPSIQLYSWE